MTLFSKSVQSYCRGLCTYPCFPGVLLTRYPKYSFQATGCFPTQPLSKQWTAASEKRIMSQLIAINPRKNIGLARIEPATSCSHFLYAIDSVTGAR